MLGLARKLRENAGNDKISEFIGEYDVSPDMSKLYQKKYYVSCLSTLLH